jgi:hypothetical protein
MTTAKMTLPPGIDPTPTKWPHYDSFALDYAVNFYPLVIQELMFSCGLGDGDLAEVAPDASIVDIRSLTMTTCPDHPNHREIFLAHEVGFGLMARIDDRFPDAVGDSPLLALLVLYTAIQECKKEQEKEQDR